MIQDIQPKVLYNQYAPEPPREEDAAFAFDKRTVLARQDESGVLSIPSVKDVGTGNLQYLFRVDDKRFYLWTAEELPEVEVCELINIMEFFQQRPADLCYAGMTAWHLNVWYHEARYCGRCGHKMLEGETLRNMVCPHCHGMTFPRVSPAVIVAVTDDEGRILVTRYNGREYKGVSLIAGFCEIGESAEETVRREVMEEAGVKVKNIRYYTSQPWGLDQNLLLGYFCEVDGNKELRIDPEELKSALWLKPEEIPQPFEMASLTMTMLEDFRNGKVKV